MAKIERKQTTIYKLELLPYEYLLIKTILQNANAENREEQNFLDDLSETFREAWVD